MFKLNKKVAAVTGGSSGIGLEIVKAFALQGASVHILDMNAPSESIEGVSFHQIDISSNAEVKKLMASIGTVDILVNNAGVSHIGTVANTSEDDFDRLLRINVKGVFNCIQAVIGQFEKQGHGNIINMCSVAASVGIADRFAYSTTKGAIRTMTFQVAKDYVSKGIRCNCISPARVYTPFVEGYLQEHYPNNKEEMFENLSKTQPIGRMAKPTEVAALAVYLASDESNFVTGTDFPVDGGFLRLNTP